MKKLPRSTEDFDVVYDNVGEWSLYDTGYRMPRMSISQNQQTDIEYGRLFVVTEEKSVACLKENLERIFDNHEVLRACFCRWIDVSGDKK